MELSKPDVASEITPPSPRPMEGSSFARRGGIAGPWPEFTERFWPATISPPREADDTIAKRRLERVCFACETAVAMCVGSPARHVDHLPNVQPERASQARDLDTSAEAEVETCEKQIGRSVLKRSHRMMVMKL